MALQRAGLRFTTSVQRAASCLALTYNGVILEDSHSPLKAMTSAMYVQLLVTLGLHQVYSIISPTLNYRTTTPLPYFYC